MDWVSTVGPSAFNSKSIPLAFQKRVLVRTNRSLGAAMNNSMPASPPGVELEADDLSYLNDGSQDQNRSTPPQQKPS